VKLPRDLTGAELVRLLSRLGYTVNRQTGSHMRLSTQVAGEHHVTIPKHSPLRIGTLAAILDAVAAHQQTTRTELLAKLLA
jgi:predicted RNA binding protein YcfA (HicA-like mRNA interferase family)